MFDKEEQNLRPAVLADYIGQTKIKEAVGIAINSAKKRNAAMPHTLLYGPPGLGKTTLAEIIANEIGGKMLYLTGATIERPKDIVPTLMQLDTNSVLFIDEIHRMDRTAEEVLYSAMEDNFVSVAIGQGEQTKQIKLTLPPFTLIGATTKAGSLTTPLRDRFGIVHRLELYDEKDLIKIINRSAKILCVEIDEEASTEIARRSRGTPRIANRLLKRVRDYAMVLGNGKIDLKIAKTALNKLEIDELGLDEIDRKILETMILKYQGKPIGIEALATTVGEDIDTLEDVYEPYLIQIGFISRTQRGRVPLPAAYKHIGASYQLQL